MIYGMLYAVAVGLPILLAAIVCSGPLRRGGRPERGVWLAGLGLALTLPIVLLMSPTSVTSSSVTLSGGSVPLPATGVIGLPDVVAVPVGRSGMGLDEVVLFAWLLASVLLTLRWAVAVYRLAGVGASWRTETVDGVSACVTDNLGPAVSGIFRPRILVPSWLASLPHEQRSLVLLHEQEHVRARDPILIAVSRIARVLAPWNPFVWLLSSRLVRAIELDCDRRVLLNRPDVEAYGTTLLTVSSRDPSRLVAAAAFAESEVPLRKRILAMTTPPRAIPVLGILTALVLGVVFLVGVFEVPIPAIRFQLDVEPPGSGVAIVEEKEATEQRVTELEVTPVETTVLEPSGVLTATVESATRAADQAGTVTGQITDAQTGEPLSAVQVYISSLQLGGLSQQDGRYLLQSVPAGTYTLAMTRIGYRTLETEITVTGGETALTATLESATRAADRWGTVTGRITDAETGEAVAAVQVYISSLQLGGLTQRNGRYLLQNVRAGTHALTIGRIGSQTVEAQITVEGGETVVQNFSVADAVAVLQPNVPTTEARTQRRSIGRANSTDAETVDPEVIAAEVTSLQQALTDGDQPLIYLDGILVPNRFFQSGGLDNLDPDDIESIEILRPAAAVALYGEEASAGVIQIRTKR